MNRFTWMAAVAVLFIAAATTNAATFQLSANFSSTFDSSGPTIGTGLLSYTAASALGNGSYDWNSFQNLTLSITFPSYTTFTQADLASSTTSLKIEVRGGGFYFSNSTPDPAGFGTKGSADFSNSSYYLTTQPVTSGSSSQSGAIYSLKLVGGSQIMGYYGAVPEPSVSLLTLSAGGLFALLRRRR